METLKQTEFGSFCISRMSGGAMDDGHIIIQFKSYVNAYKGLEFTLSYEQFAKAVTAFMVTDVRLETTTRIHKNV